MINVNFAVSGTSYDDVKDLRISRTMGDYNSVSSFQANIDSPYGRHAGDFQIGQNVKIYGGEGILNGLVNIRRI